MNGATPMGEKKKAHDRLPELGAESAKARKDATVVKVRATIELIDEEIAANHGVYPYPGKRLSEREFCRRAGIHYQTLRMPAHKDTTKLEVEAFLSRHTGNKTKQAIKATVTGKIDYWQGEHAKVATQIAQYELELAERDSDIQQLRRAHEDELNELRTEINRLTAENKKWRERLSKALSGENVSPIRTKRRPKEE
jgi:FtsZ-binding cell division protein ZapB